MGNRPVKEVGQQGVGDRSDHFLGATFPFRWCNQRVHGPVLGPDHGYGDEEEGFAKPRQIGENHFPVLLLVEPVMHWAFETIPVCC